MTAFNQSEIPLSAFAFFGGALAIGIGFGTQNLLKNLISGVMLLIEKPIRIGDLVEIDGITGTVTMIRNPVLDDSWRAGHRHADSKQRAGRAKTRELDVLDTRRPQRREGFRGVRLRCGQGTRSVADRHAVAQIRIRTPAPLITLEDFGNDGLVFNVQFWLQIQAGVSILRIMSDIRLSILKAFNEAGIEIPFPQRVLRFRRPARAGSDHGI